MSCDCGSSSPAGRVRAATDGKRAGSRPYGEGQFRGAGARRGLRDGWNDPGRAAPGPPEEQLHQWQVQKFGAKCTHFTTPGPNTEGRGARTRSRELWP